VSRAFEARYTSRCSACDERIYEGDLIRFDADDHVLHDDCTAHVPRERKSQPVCGSCFTELPVTGVCGVCE
jgi:hypothetical protein